MPRSMPPLCRRSSSMTPRLRTAPAALLLLLLVYSLLLGATFSQPSCPLELHAYTNSASCSVGTPADAVGIIYPDNQCRGNDVLSGSRPELLPGNYRAECNPDGRVRIYESGCTSSDCFSSNNGLCDRQLSYASLYSRLSPPLYELQDPNATFVSCFVLSSADESYKVVFYIFGDCGPCLSNATDTPSAVDTLAPTLAPAAPSVPPTLRPTLRPTGAPTADPAAGPTTPSPTWEPTAMGTYAPSLSVDDNFDKPSAAPSAGSHSKSNTVGIVAGSVVGVLAALVCFLTTGFLLGRRLHNNGGDGSRKSLAEVASQDKTGPGGQAMNGGAYLPGTLSTPMTTPGSFFHPSPTGTASFEAPIPADHNIMISIEEQDDISTLEDPTVYTRDTSATRESLLGTGFLPDGATASSALGAAAANDDDDDADPDPVAALFQRPRAPSSGPLRPEEELGVVAGGGAASVANDSRAADTTASSVGGGGVGAQTTTSRFTTESSSVIGVAFLNDTEDTERKLLGGAPQPPLEDDDDMSNSWRPGAKWFGLK